MVDHPSLEDVIKRLGEAGIQVETTNRLKNDKGWRIDCTNGAIVNFYDTGSFVVQGKSRDEVNKALGIIQQKEQAKPSVAYREQKIFVVYGHDRGLRNELEVMLRRWGLTPLILDTLASGGATIIEKLERYATDDISYAVVLATPDDEGREFNSEEDLRPRVRQNVVLELGMLLAKLGRRKVAIVIKTVKNMERPSDIDGLIYLPFSESIEEIKADLAKEMDGQGVNIEWRNL